MTKNFKKVMAVALAAAMVFGMTACGGSQSDNSDPSKITVCLDWTPNTNHTGLYVAQAQGYFEEAGLEVEIVQPAENSAAQMCAAGQAQFAIEAQDTMAASLAADEPLGITAVAAIIQHNTSGIMSRKGDGIDTPAGLTGKTYSTWESPIELAMLENVVNEHGGDFSKVKQIPNDITDEPAALAAKQTDAIWVFEGWGRINADINNVPVDYFSFSDVNPTFDYYTPVIIANNDYLADNPELAKAFMAAVKKGYEFAAENPEEAADMLIEGDNTGSLAESRDLVVESQKFLSKLYIDDAASWGIIDENRWNAFYGWLYDNKLCNADLTGKGFTNDFLAE